MKSWYAGEVEGPNNSGRPLEKWKDRAKEYICEKVLTEGKECAWILRGSFAVATTLKDVPEGIKAL